MVEDSVISALYDSYQLTTFWPALFFSYLKSVAATFSIIFL